MRKFLEPIADNPNEAQRVLSSIFRILYESDEEPGVVDTNKMWSAADVLSEIHDVIERSVLFADEIS